MDINNLHSDKLKLRFGDIFLKIINQSNLMRVSTLSDNTGTVRTLAVSLFSHIPYSPEINKIHKKVSNGGFIGDSIVSSGANILRKKVCKFKVITPLIMSSEEIMTQGLYSRIFIGSNRHKEFYCDLCEVYHPEFNPKEEIISYTNIAYTNKITLLLNSYQKLDWKVELYK